MAGRALVAAVALGALMCAGCTTEGELSVDDRPSRAGTSAAPTSPANSPPSSAANSRPSPQPTATPPDEPPPDEPDPAPPRFRARAALSDVRLLAGEIGPRLTTTPAYRRAARFVEQRLSGLGYDVRRQSFPVPAGGSWGVPVRAGRSFNVIAEPPGFDPGRPHRIVGAHLDTVAVAPGAEDNASGVAVLLEAARLAAEAETALPTVFIAFGGEEPRGDGDALHHFGSTRYVQRMPAPQRRSLQAMVALDRVGVGDSVPVCTGPLSPQRVQRALRTTARLMGIRTRGCVLTTSDHWSFEKAGFTVARLGSTPFAGYHSPADLPRVVDVDQLERTGRLIWAWLATPGRS